MSDFESEIWSRLRLYLSNEYGIAGLMGNLKAESSLIPYRLQGDYQIGYEASLEYTSNVNNGIITAHTFEHDQKGYGLAQWTAIERKTNLYNFRPVTSVSIGSMDRQIPFMVEELINSYPAVWNKLNNAGNIREASNIVLHEYEAPLDQSEAVEIQRYNLSLSIYNNQHGSEPQPPTPPEPAPPTPTPTPGGTIPLWMMMYKRRKNLT